MRDFKSSLYYFSMPEFKCHFDWFPKGASEAAARGDIIVIVDVLSFSTSVAYAVNNGAIIIPCFDPDLVEKIAEQNNALISVSRSDVPLKGKYSLSPATFLNAASGEKIVLASPNGARCCLNSAGAQQVIIGGIVNARAVADFVKLIIESTGKSVNVIACGEREYGSFDGELREAEEDYLGAGAIISYLNCNKTKEALACETYFDSHRENLATKISNCQSGVELSVLGYNQDVDLAIKLNCLKVVPVFENGNISSIG